MTDSPLILVTNDDGIHAPGIRALIAEVQAFGRVIVVAPDKPQSGMGHAITINSFLRLEPVMIAGTEAWSCSGTPVDCVKIAIYKLLNGKRPDLVVSGINHGSNVSTNVLYSGTMSAAVEGAMETIPSIGFSLLDHAQGADFTQARSVVKSIVANALKHGIAEGTCLNVNIPKNNGSALKGIRICRQAKANWEDEFETRLDPSGKEYYWLKGEFKNEDHGEDTDVWAVSNGFVSVVPTQFDLTAHHAMAQLNTWEHAIG
ncbi:MAG TPA: 5'/3'-nucleotidase SurE [Flavobacteriales bacterium]|nr:5'/3'-nucleotidase SurE [Flavobacteriales bacterium]